MRLLLDTRKASLLPTAVSRNGRLYLIGKGEIDTTFTDTRCGQCGVPLLDEPTTAEDECSVCGYPVGGSEPASEDSRVWIPDGIAGHGYNINSTFESLLSQPLRADIH